MATNSDKKHGHCDPSSETTITGEVSILGVTDPYTAVEDATDNGALFRVDGLQISEGTFPAAFVGPEQVRKGWRDKLGYRRVKCGQKILPYNIQ